MLVPTSHHSHTEFKAAAVYAEDADESGSDFVDVDSDLYEPCNAGAQYTDNNKNMRIGHCCELSADKADYGGP